MRKKIVFLGLLAFTAVGPLFAQETLTSSTDSEIAFSKKAVEEVNTSYSELRPLITADGNILYFSRRGGKKKGPDIYVVRKDPETGRWGDVKHLSRRFNNKRWNAVVSANPSGKELVLFNTYRGTGYTPLVRIVKEKGLWQEPLGIPIQEYENFSPYSDFFVDYNQNVLLMAIETVESIGDQDLHVSFPQGKSGWSKPVNMGPVVNSAAPDFAPFMSTDGWTLFFSSYGHDDMQEGSDIFMSVRLDDSWTNWSVPVKLGPDINTEDDENYLSLDEDSQHMYYTSQKAGEELSGDIERIVLPEDFTAINGPVLVKLNSQEILKIMDSGQYKISPDGSPTNVEGIAFAGWPKEAEPEEVMEIAAADLGGAEEEKMLAEEESLPVKGERNSTAEAVSSLSAEAAALLEYLQQQMPGIDLAISQKGDTTEFKLVQNILYDFNSIYPSEKYYQRLSNIAKVLKEKKDLKVQLIGHTDSLGSAEVNERVSSFRVRHIRRYLEDSGLSSNRLEVLGAGQGAPIAPNETDEGRNLNRRVETIIRFIEK